MRLVRPQPLQFNALGLRKVGHEEKRIINCYDSGDYQAGEESFEKIGIGSMP